MGCSGQPPVHRIGCRRAAALTLLVLCTGVVGCADADVADVPDLADDDWRIDSKSLDPQAREFLDELERTHAPGWGSMTPSRGRAVFAGLRLYGVGPDDVETRDLVLADRIKARAYKPHAAAASSSPLPVVVFFHGGGWVLGDLDTHDAVCRRISKEANCAVISIDYRRAPEHPFPAAPDDCYDATVFVAENAAELEVDAKRLVVAGDSAGANLAADTALRARDAHGPPILAQMLIYPALDAACNSASYETYASGFGLTKADMQWFWRQYLGEGVDDARAQPSKAASVAGLPPTFILTAQYDVLRDEGEAFARRLRDAGGKVRLHRIGGMVHGFVHFAGKFDAGLQATSEIARELTSRFQSAEY